MYDDDDDDRPERRIATRVSKPNAVNEVIVVIVVHGVLRAATPSNPRNRPCPTCGKKNRLTPADVRRHYQCDECADRLERGRGY
jgi:hypothetical protein